jgi:hypothetical protein
MLLLLLTSFLFLPLCFSFNNVTQRIVGGQEVGWDRYPYFGLLETRWRDGASDEVRTSWCGSVLIAKSTLLVRFTIRYKSLNQILLSKNFYLVGYSLFPPPL